MTPELIKMKELMLKTYLDEHGCEYFNLSTDLDQYATAYLDEAIRLCVPEYPKCNPIRNESGVMVNCACKEKSVHDYIDELLSKIERFKNREMV